jgi:hypothetical protein
LRVHFLLLKPKFVLPFSSPVKGKPFQHWDAHDANIVSKSNEDMPVLLAVPKPSASNQQKNRSPKKGNASTFIYVHLPFQVQPGYMPHVMEMQNLYQIARKYAQDQVNGIAVSMFGVNAIFGKVCLVSSVHQMQLFLLQLILKYCTQSWTIMSMILSLK